MSATSGLIAAALGILALVASFIVVIELGGRQLAYVSMSQAEQANTTRRPVPGSPPDQEALDDESTTGDDESTAARLSPVKLRPRAEQTLRSRQCLTDDLRRSLRTARVTGATHRAHRQVGRPRRLAKADHPR
jgi:hypothetical protein